MTTQQKKQIKEYRDKFDKNVKDYEVYGSKEACIFNVYGPDEEDNYVLGISSIVGTENYQVLTQIGFIMINKDGNAVSLSEMYPQSQIIKYIERLKKV